MSYSNVIVSNPADGSDNEIIAAPGGGKRLILHRVMVYGVAAATMDISLKSMGGVSGMSVVGNDTNGITVNTAAVGADGPLIVEWTPGLELPVNGNLALRVVAGQSGAEDLVVLVWSDITDGPT